MSHSKEGVLQINIHDVRTDGGTQIREAIDDALVREYAEKLKEGHYFPDVIVFYDGTNYWLADGFHRVEAARLAGHTTIDAEARPGTKRDALLHACGANADHGKRRTRADMRRAVETLLRDPEWTRQSDRWIAQHCNTTHSTVSHVRKELGSTGEISQSPKRIGANGRAIDVTKIGRTEAVAAPQMPENRETTDPPLRRIPQEITEEMKELASTFKNTGEAVLLSSKVIRGGAPALVKAVDDGESCLRIAVDLIDTSSCIGREWIDPELVKKYIEQMRSGDTFPPIEVFHDGSTYWLADGHHRLCAMTYFDVNGEDIGIGLREVACTIHQGTEDDAAWYSAGANKTHGFPTTKSDKNSCIREIFRHPGLLHFSNAVIAKQVGCDVSWVCKKRTEIGSPVSESQVSRSSRKGVDGVSRPATQQDAEQQRDAVAEAVLANPDASTQAIASTTGASKATVKRIKKAATANPDMPASELAKRKGSAPKAEEKAPFSSTW